MKILKKLKSKQGFTLIECLVAIVVFSIMSMMIAMIITASIRTHQNNVTETRNMKEQRQDLRAGGADIDARGPESMIFEFGPIPGKSCPIHGGSCVTYCVNFSFDAEISGGGNDGLELTAFKTPAGIRRDNTAPMTSNFSFTRKQVRLGITSSASLNQTYTIGDDWKFPITAAGNDACTYKVPASTLFNTSPVIDRYAHAFTTPPTTGDVYVNMMKVEVFALVDDDGSVKTISINIPKNKVEGVIGFIVDGNLTAGDVSFSDNNTSYTINLQGQPDPSGTKLKIEFPPNGFVFAVVTNQPVHDMSKWLGLRAPCSNCKKCQCVDPTHTTDPHCECSLCTKCHKCKCTVTAHMNETMNGTSVIPHCDGLCPP